MAEQSDAINEVINEVKEVKEVIEVKEETKVKEVKGRTIIESIEYGIETLLRYMFFWESDDKKIGMMIQIFHHAFIYGMVLWYIYLHIFSHSYLQFIVFYFICFLVWIQHLFCGDCLIFIIEKKLIGNHSSIMDNLIDIFHITPTEGLTNGILLIMSSLVMAMLTGELLSRTIVGITQFL